MVLNQEVVQTLNFFVFSEFSKLLEESCSEEEHFHTAAGLYTLAFNKEVRETMKSTPGIIEGTS